MKENTRTCKTPEATLLRAHALTCPYLRTDCLHKKAGSLAAMHSCYFFLQVVGSAWDADERHGSDTRCRSLGNAKAMQAKRSFRPGLWSRCAQCSGFAARSVAVDAQGRTVWLQLLLRRTDQFARETLMAATTLSAPSSTAISKADAVRTFLTNQIASATNQDIETVNILLYYTLAQVDSLLTACKGRLRLSVVSGRLPFGSPRRVHLRQEPAKAAAMVPVVSESCAVPVR